MTYVCPTVCQYAEDVGVLGAASPPCPGGYCDPYAPDPCEQCGGPVGEDGCRCDGHALCSACLHLCPACLASMADDWSLT